MDLTQSIYGLQVDYKKQHGHYMTLTAADGLRQEELSEFQLRMLSVNRIPKLLDMQVEAKDGRLTLYYNMTGKRMLTQGLRIEPITLQQYYGLLLQIVEVLIDSGKYMLQPGRYILKEEFMFYGVGLDDLYLTYVPKEHLEGKASISTDLQHLASRWIHRVVELQGNGFQELMRYLQEETFNLPELKALLLRQLERLTVSTTAASVGPSAVIQEMMEVKDSSALRPSPSPPVAPLLMEAPWRDDALLKASEKSEKPWLEPRKKRLLVLLGTVLALCFVWKQYAEEPNEQMLYVSAGCTVVLAAASAWGCRRAGREPLNGQSGSDEPASVELNGLEEEEAAKQAFFSRAGLFESPQAPIAAPLTTADPGGYAFQPSAWNHRGSHAVQSSSGNEPGKALQPSYWNKDSGNTMYSSLWHESPVRSDLAGRTTLLRPSDATVLLSPSQEGAIEKKPYLEVLREGVRERIELTKPSFVIGRQGAEADLVMKEPGVSRLHAEFVKEKDGYAVKDLGSRNGTRLNGELLVPYQSHPLGDGDIVKIVSTEITYKV